MRILPACMSAFTGGMAAVIAVTPEVDPFWLSPLVALAIFNALVAVMPR